MAGKLKLPAALQPLANRILFWCIHKKMQQRTTVVSVLVALARVVAVVVAVVVATTAAVMVAVAVAVRSWSQWSRS